MCAHFSIIWTGGNGAPAQARHEDVGGLPRARPRGVGRGTLKGRATGKGEWVGPNPVAWAGQKGNGERGLGGAQLGPKQASF